MCKIKNKTSALIYECLESFQQKNFVCLLRFLKAFALFLRIRLNVYVLLIVSLRKIFNVSVKSFFLNYPIINCLEVISSDTRNYVYSESGEVREQTTATTILLEAPLMQTRKAATLTSDNEINCILRRTFCLALRRSFGILWLNKRSRNSQDARPLMDGRGHV